MPVETTTNCCFPYRREATAAQAFLERNRALASEPFAVDRFILYESRLSRHGAHYEEIADYPLT